MRRAEFGINFGKNDRHTPIDYHLCAFIVSKVMMKCGKKNTPPFDDDNVIG